jgi:hypothetical protein
LIEPPDGEVTREPKAVYSFRGRKDRPPDFLAR